MFVWIWRPVRQNPVQVQKLIITGLGGSKIKIGAVPFLHFLTKPLDFLVTDTVHTNVVNALIPSPLKEKAPKHCSTPLRNELKYSSFRETRRLVASDNKVIEHPDVNQTEGTLQGQREELVGPTGFGNP